MIITEKKPFGIIKPKLKKNSKISIASCNECARLCETGGKKGIEETEEKLKKEGYEVVDRVLVPMMCDKDIDQKMLKPKGDVVLVLACDAGAYNVDQLFKDKKVINCLDTIGLGIFDEKGNLKLIKKF